MADKSSPISRLVNKTVLVACSAQKAAGITASLRAMGANVLILPVLDIKEIVDKTELDKALRSLSDYGWIIFTSSNAVEFFMRRLNELRIDKKSGIHPKICAIGPFTAVTIREYGWDVDLLPENFVAEGILKALEKYHNGLQHIADCRILLPRAKEARDVLPDALIKTGAQVNIVPCYETVMPERDEDVIRQIRSMQPDLMIFTSSKTIKNFIGILGPEYGIKMLREATVAAIGPITANTAESFGKCVEILPLKNTIESLVEAIRDYYSCRL
jgi:uroporphyrinogen III methyltransferase/synthase